MIELTSEQRRQLEGAEVPRAVDPETRKTYVLVSEEVYERLKGLLGGDFRPGEAYPAIDRAFAEGWDDPRMDDYDRYEALKKCVSNAATSSWPGIRKLSENVPGPPGLPRSAVRKPLRCAPSPRPIPPHSFQSGCPSPRRRESAPRPSTGREGRTS